MAILEKLIGTLRLREAWKKIDRNEKAINDEIVSHKASNQAHSSSSITYSGEVAATNVQEAIDKTNQRVSNILSHNGDGTKDSELIDARGGATVLGDRLNGLDAQLAEIVTNMRKEFESRSVNLLWFKHLSDGNDWTVAIKEAISFVYTMLDGGVVYVPEGVYYVKSRIEVPSNVALIGVDKELSIIKKHEEHMHSDIILIRDTESNILIKGLQIDGVKSDSNTVTNKGINIQGHNVKVSQCKIINIKTNDCIYIGNSNTQSNGAIISDNEFDYPDRHAIASINSKGVRIEGNKITNCGLYAIDFEPNNSETQSNDDFFILNNDINNTAQHGIVATIKARNGCIQGNNLKSIGSEGIIVAYDSIDITVQDNHLDLIGTVGIAVRLGANKVSIHRNRVKNAGTYGIRIGNSTTDAVSRVSVSHNVVVDPNRNNASYDYIRLEALTLKCLVSFNDCYSESGINLPVYGLNLQGTKHRIFGNNFDDYTSNNAISVATGDNIFYGDYGKGSIRYPMYVNGVQYLSGNGSPEGVQSAGAGSLYSDKSNGKLYFKTSAGSTGWREVSFV